MKKRRGRPPKYRDPSNDFVRVSSGRAALVERAALDLERKRNAPATGQVMVTRKDGSTYWRAPRGANKPKNGTEVSQRPASDTKPAKGITKETPFKIVSCENCKRRIADAKPCPGCSKKMCAPCARIHGNLCDECHATPE